MVLAISSLLAPAVVKRFPAKYIFIIAAAAYVLFVVAQVWGK